MALDNKYVYLSYDDADKEIALQLQEVLENTLTGEVWIRHLDLRAGDLVADILSDAISEVKWFILVLTNNSLDSEWIKKELRLLTIRWLEGMNFNLVVINADNCNLPRDLKIAMESHYVLNLHKVEDKQDEFVRLSIYIEEKNVARPERKVFVDRGREVDQFIYSAKYHPIVFVLGTAGIGKTSLVLNKFGPQLRKQPIEVSFSKGKGDSIDYLMREILRKTHVKQPMDSNQIKDDELISLAVEAIKKRERHYFLFIDNLEYALTANHELPIILIEFLEKFFVNEVRTNVIFASTRVPTYPASMTSSFDVIRLNLLPDIYIHQCFDEWLSDHPKHNEYLNSSHMENLIRVADGYPLAALMLATSLKSGIPPQVVLQSSEIKRLRLSLAGHILDSLLRERLSELESLILQVLGLINEPVPVDDLISIETFAQYSPEQIQEAVYKLINRTYASDIVRDGFLSC